MPRTGALVPWGRGRAARWAYGLASTGVILFVVALVVRLDCVPYGCVGSSAERVLNLDEIGGLPRLFTTGLFLATAVVAFRGSRRVTGPARTWWTLVTLVGVGLTVAKVLSAHSLAKAAGPMATLVVGVAVTAVTLTVLRVTARRWGVPAGTPMVWALGWYAVAALGLDLVTGAAATLQGSEGPVAVAVATFVEELGEALTALVVLVTAYTHAPEATVRAPVGPEEPSPLLEPGH